MSETKKGAADKARNGEKIGGGFFIFRRHRKSGRIHPSPWPFEHADAESAVAQAKKLAIGNVGHEFIVVGEFMSYRLDAEGKEPTIIFERRALTL